MHTKTPIKVSVIIKALNEEKRIGEAIRTAIEAADRVGGEVILADSVSTDRTIEIARQYPIRIVQLENAEERRCGAGPQLGYQIARGEFIYILDGDMELDPDFLPAAIAEMERNERLAGVGGIVEEVSDASYQFRGRQRRKTESISGHANSLDMGGLYRKSAVHAVGYFSNRNLHAYEELELGLRLTSAGWKLYRLPIRSVVHYGHTEGNLALLRRRWKSRYLDGGGELLQASLGKSHFWRAAWTQKHVLLGLMLWLGLVAGLFLIEVAPWILILTTALLMILILLRFRRIGNFSDALFGQVVWQVTALSILRGFFSAKTDPYQPLEYVALNAANSEVVSRQDETKIAKADDAD